MNAVWEGEVRQRSQIVLGIAVATDRGVVAPVLADVERIPLVQLVKQRAAITDRARQSRLTFTDLEGGVGTLSNLGMYPRRSFLKGSSPQDRASFLPLVNCANGHGWKISPWSSGQPLS